MTIEEAILEKLRRLPLERQQELLNFAELLVQETEADGTRPKVDWQNSCVGMWQNREDMRDSGTWVRRIRQQEWNGYSDATSSS